MAPSAGPNRDSEASPHAQKSDQRSRDDRRETADSISISSLSDAETHSQGALQLSDALMHEESSSHDVENVSSPTTRKSGIHPTPAIAINPVANDEAVQEDVLPSHSPSESNHLSKVKRGRRGRRRRNTNGSAVSSAREAEAERNVPSAAVKVGSSRDNGSIRPRVGRRATGQQAGVPSGYGNAHHHNPFPPYPTGGYFSTPYTPLVPYPPLPRSNAGQHTHTSPANAPYDMPQQLGASRGTNSSPSVHGCQKHQHNAPQSKQHPLYSHHAASAPVLMPTTTSPPPDPQSDNKIGLQERYREVLKEPGLVAARQPSSARPVIEEEAHVPGSEVRSIRSDDLAFSVPIQCSHATLHSRFSTLLHQYWPERTAHNDSGDVWVWKAMSSKRFRKRDGSQSIELMCHSGPTPAESSDYQIQWLYVFRNVTPKGCR